MSGHHTCGEARHHYNEVVEGRHIKLPRADVGQPGDELYERKGGQLREQRERKARDRVEFRGPHIIWRGC